VPLSALNTSSQFSKLVSSEARDNTNGPLNPAPSPILIFIYPFSKFNSDVNFSLTLPSLLAPFTIG
jgi:hypothetical protein